MADKVSDVTTVWIAEICADHAPSYGTRVFSTKERAKASLPQVRKWKTWDDGSESEDVGDSWRDCWVLTPMVLDPEPDA